MLSFSTGFSFQVPLCILKFSISSEMSASSSSVYFYNLNQFIFTNFIKNNNEGDRRSGTTWIGVSQKDLQISKRTKEDKNAKKLVEKRARALQVCRGQ